MGKVSASFVNAPEKVIRCSVDEGFARWIAGASGSVVITTYQAGRAVLVGWNGKEVTVLPRALPKPMGMATDGTTMAMACKNEVILFVNSAVLAPHYPEEGCGKYDALYLPRVTHVTGDLNIHDMAFGTQGLWIVNTRFSCLSLLSRSFSFEPSWQPPFVSRLVPEDRCHLNGLAMLDGVPKYVTALATTDEPGAWRACKTDGGVVIDVESGQCSLTGLCMPHSPRRYDGKWWMLNSGLGELCVMDPETGEYEVVCRLPGYARGLCFAGHHAVVGLSKIRSSHAFEGLPVQDHFDELLCGAAVVDLQAGENLGVFKFTDGCDELYDVQFLSGVARPSILNTSNEATYRAVTAPQFAYWLYETDKEEKSAAGTAKED